MHTSIPFVVLTLFGSSIEAMPVDLNVLNTFKRRDTDLDATRCLSFCIGTTNDNSESSICSDSRLGPSILPTSLPLSSLAGVSSSYHRFGGLCPGEYISKWTSSGSYVYPPLNGFALDTTGNPIQARLTLETGTILDRFGSEFGTFMSPAGAPYNQRALPPTNLNAAPGAAYPYNYHVYQVSRPFTALAGPIAPWFGQMGMGTQFQLDLSVGALVDQGYLLRVNLTANPDW